MRKIIYGIQQIGIGVTDVQKAFKWYRRNFEMDIRVFEDASVAKLMLPHTDNKPWERHAILAISIQGGGGFEIWQHTEKVPQMIEKELVLGDLGINITKMKSWDIKASYNLFKSKSLNILGEITTNPDGKKHFFVKDPYNNIFEFVEFDVFFTQKDFPSGGVCGCIIGVSDIERAKKVYCDILGYKEIVYDKGGAFYDLKVLTGGSNKVRRVLLNHSNRGRGGFSRLLGPTQIELIEVKDRTPNKIYEGRIWGDPGFIHLCFDVTGMNSLREECEKLGYPFTVDSSQSFDMGEAAGHFTYIQDSDGTLIEFVETHKVPIIKKLGIYLNMKKRDPSKPLPNWMVRSMSLNRVKDKRRDKKAMKQ